MKNDHKPTKFNENTQNDQINELILNVMRLKVI